jgi:CRP-like cAMP-binding protein
MRSAGWPTEAFESALIRYPILQRNVNNILRRRLGEIQSRTSRISSTQADSKRLAHELVRLANPMGPA